MQITRENYTEARAAIVEYILKEIEVFAQNAGSRDRLSVALGHPENYVRLKLSRCRDSGSIDALEDLLEECRNKIKGDR